MKKRKNDPFFSQPIILPLIPQHIYDFLASPHKKDTEGSKQSKQATRKKLQATRQAKKTSTRRKDKGKKNDET